MSAGHRRPLYAFVAVFVVAILVVAGTARSDALRDLVRERSVDVVAATTLELVGVPEPPRVAAGSEADASEDEAVLAPARTPGKGKAASGTAKSRAGHERAARAGKGKGEHGHARPPGRAKGHDKVRGKGKGEHGHARPPGRAKGHDKSRGKGKGEHGR